MITFAFILLIVGALIAFIGAALVKKSELPEEKKDKLFYAVKIVGLWLVIIGAVLIFRENGSFGMK